MLTMLHIEKNNEKTFKCNSNLNFLSLNITCVMYYRYNIKIKILMALFFKYISLSTQLIC